jgi:hypothetical protein
MTRLVPTPSVNPTARLGDEISNIRAVLWNWNVRSRHTRFLERNDESGIDEGIGFPNIAEGSTKGAGSQEVRCKPG